MPNETEISEGVSSTQIAAGATSVDYEGGVGGGEKQTTNPQNRLGENDDGSEDDDYDYEGGDPVGFEGWARVFFQARDDRAAQQILPTISSTLARETHLYIVASATELRIYPNEDDQRLIIDPPIELKYFYATKVPGSQAGAALFLKEDDRELRRYIFRFEFRNDAVLQPPSRAHQLGLSAKAAKQLQKTSHLKRMGLKTKAAFVNEEEKEDMQRSEEKKSQGAHMAYLEILGDMISDASNAADSFIGTVNSALEKEDDTWKRRPGQSWGAGYEDPKSVGAHSDDSDFSSDFESLNEVDDDNEKPSYAAKAEETIEQSFEKMFREKTQDE